MNGTDMNLDITYQDTQYLAELYNKLGSLQYDLSNFDIIATNEKIFWVVAIGGLGIVLGLLVLTALCGVFDRTDFDLIGPIIGMVIYGILVIVIWYFVSDWAITLKEHDIMREIEATETAIEAIKMKYGWI